MTHRLALAAASLAAAATLAVALAAAGFMPPTGGRATAPADPAVTGGRSAPTLQVDTIYVAPPPPQQTITIDQPAGGEPGEADEHEVGDD